MPNPTDTSTPLLTPTAAAKFLGVTWETLKHWRRDKTGPRYYRVGHKMVRYTVADLMEWVAKHAIEAAA